MRHADKARPRAPARRAKFAASRRARKNGRYAQKALDRCDGGRGLLFAGKGGDYGPFFPQYSRNRYRQSEHRGQRFCRARRAKVRPKRCGERRHGKARFRQASPRAHRAGFRRRDWRSGAQMQREPGDDDGGNGGRRACISGGIRPLGRTAAEPSNCHDKLYG